MSNRHGYTSIGGGNANFFTTQWSEIMSVRTSDQQRQEQTINNLIEKYWKPVYCAIRRKGFSNEDSKDLTQDFFEAIVLSKELIQKADKAKGKFRTFLLTALDHFIINANRKKNAKKRRPDGGVRSFQIQDELDIPPDQHNMSAEEVFNYAWACELLEEVFKLVEIECKESDMQLHWKVFQKKVVLPIIAGKPAPEMPEICKKYNLKSPQKASNMIVTVKRMFRRILESQLGKYAQDETGITDEFNQLFQILSRGGAS